ncbi:MAG TPA: CoA-binding protein [Candidatus Lokiarchaeia archaeon]|nr:CoA-binding protein [Candidatus Lokiarchaeia archaeon]
MKFDLNPVFFPKTIAVIGVSTTNLFNPGQIIFQRNLFFKGYESDCVFGVNPKGGIVEGKELYKSLFDIPKNIDLAVFCLKAADTIPTLNDAIELGVKGVIVISGGFSEVGAEGKAAQDEMTRIAVDNNIPLVGPNCIGVYNPPHVNTFIVPNERFVMPKSNGNVAIVSQSGGVLVDQWLGKFFERDIAISKAVSLGNKAMIDEVDMLEFFARDAETDVIGFYLEGFANGRGREFLLKSRETTKTILLLKGGKTERGMKAASSHTAAIASNGAILDGALKQFSIINVNTEQELTAYAKSFSLLAGKNKPFFTSSITGNLAIITVSGGHGVLSSDIASKYDLKLVEFTDAEKDEILEALSPTIKAIAGTGNPIDLTGSCSDDDVVNVLNLLMRNDRVDLILLLILPYPPMLTMSLGSRIANIVRIHHKPVIVYLPWVAKYEMIKEPLNESNIPVGNSIEEALLMAKAVCSKSNALARAKYNKIIGPDDILISDYQQFTQVLHEIDQQRVKKRMRNTIQDEREP